MLLIVIKRKPKIFDNIGLLHFRNFVLETVASIFQLNVDEFEVENKVANRTDICAPLSITIHTGPGRNRRYLKDQRKLALEIQQEVLNYGPLDRELIGPYKMYVRIQVCDEVCVPVGSPELLR